MKRQNTRGYNTDCNSDFFCFIFVPLQVFLKYYHIEQLNLFLREVIGRVVVMQAYIKGWLGARRYKKVKDKRENSAITIQSGKCSYSLFYWVSLHFSQLNSMYIVNLLIPVYYEVQMTGHVFSPALCRYYWFTSKCYFSMVMSLFKYFSILNVMSVHKMKILLDMSIKTCSA